MLKAAILDKPVAKRNNSNKIIVTFLFKECFSRSNIFEIAR
jgi:hypothetical protein